jgi:hypothetical protein
VFFCGRFFDSTRRAGFFLHHPRCEVAIVSHGLLKLCGALTVALVLIALAPRPAMAIGYWNVPGNVCQCWGYGNGAGYHAPLVLGPLSCKGCLAHNERRLPYAPAPPCYWMGCGSQSGCAIGEPSMLESEVMPEPTPAVLLAKPMPAPASDPAAFRVPFRY